jgi:GNAT superfamily N-acetyltransferase
MATDSPLAHVPHGMHDLPAGTLANVVTFLEMHERPAPRPIPGPAAGAHLANVSADPHRYLAVYRCIGALWIWTGRLEMDEPTLAARLSSPAVEAWVVVHEGRDCGLLELDFAHPGEAELTYFGLVAEAAGTGLGRWLMEQAMERAWSRPIRRFWVHTCTFDDPGAVAFYRRSGFRPYKLAVEFLPDPRLTGLYPVDHFPHLPLPR